MAVSNVSPIKKYIGNGSTTTFTFPFRIFKDSDVLVFIDNVQKNIGIDYSVSGAGNNNGGNVVFNSAPANNTKVVLQRSITTERLTDYIEGGGLSSDTLDYDFDSLEMQIQDLDYRALSRGFGQDNWDLENVRLINVANPINNSDAATQGWVNARTLNDLSNTLLPTPSTGDYVKWNGSAWINSGLVDLPDPINAGDAVNRNYINNLTLENLANVNSVVPTNESFLKYKSATGWTSSTTLDVPTPNQGSQAANKDYVDTRNLTDLNNTLCPTPTNGDYLTWNGSAWVNGGLIKSNAPINGVDVANKAYVDGRSLGDNPDVSLSNPVNGDVLKFNGTAWINEAPGGAGSLLNADLLDGLDSTQFVRSDQPVNSDTLDNLDSTQFIRADVQDDKSGVLKFVNQPEGVEFVHNPSSGVFNPPPAGKNLITGGVDGAGVGGYPNNINISTWQGFSISPSVSGQPVVINTPAFSVNARNGNVYAKGDFIRSDGNNNYKVWHEGNDGPNSGLNADTVWGYGPTSSNIADKLVLRDSSGDIHCRLIRSEYPAQTAAPASTSEMIFRNAGGTGDNYLRALSKAGAIEWLKGQRDHVQTQYTERRDSPFIAAANAYIPLSNNSINNNQGTQIHYLAVNIRYTNSLVVVEGVCHAEMDGTSRALVCPVFIDSEVNSNWVFYGNASGGYATQCYYKAFWLNLSPGTHEFRVRVGNTSNAGMTLNKNNTSNYGARIASTMTVTEYKG